MRYSTTASVASLRVGPADDEDLLLVVPAGRPPQARAGRLAGRLRELGVQGLDVLLRGGELPPDVAQVGSRGTKVVAGLGPFAVEPRHVLLRPIEQHAEGDAGAE